MNSKFIDEVRERFPGGTIPEWVCERIRAYYEQCERCKAYKYPGRKVHGVYQCTCPNWEEIDAPPEREKQEKVNWIAPNELSTHHRSPTYGEKLASGFHMLRWWE